MTPAELNHWAAEFMGWRLATIPHPYFDGRLVDVYIDKGPDPVVEKQHYNPDKDHNQCQRVIEKAIEEGMDLRTFALELSRNASMYDIGRIILATPEQKLQAVWQACKEMEKR